MTSVKSCAFALLAVACLLPPAVEGQTLTTLHAFHAKGRYPHAGVVNVGSHLVGTTFFGGGPADAGTVYKISLAGGPAETTSHAFSGAPDGAAPEAPFVKVGSLLYGTTVVGGAADFGTVFSINTGGTNYTILHSFLGTDGRNPTRGLVYAGGYFYGITNADGPSGFGTVFKMDISGTVTTLHAFTGGSDGGAPQSGLLKIGSYLYGTAYNGGGSGNGTVFRVKTDGTHFLVLHTFAGGTADGQLPFFDDLVSFAGSVWGTTPYGGQWGKGIVYRVDPDGHNYSVVHAFAGAPSDAGYAIGPMLVVYPDAGHPAVLYGTTSTGGASDKGAVFKVDANGVETLVYSFTGGADGGIPQTNLINVPDSLGSPHLYGTANAGGQWGYGTVFEFTP
jgi:uncharacterized repeat protein (TIGR03803 family)